MIPAPPDEALTGFRRVSELLRLNRLRVSKMPSVRAYPCIAEEGARTSPSGRGFRNSRSGFAATRSFSGSGEGLGSAEGGDDEDDEEGAPENAEGSETDNSSDEGRQHLLDSLPWNEQALHAVYKKFSEGEDMEVRTDDLVLVLRYLGLRPVEEDVVSIVQAMTHYTTLDWDEFVQFIKKFREHDISILKQQFMLADSDDSGSLDIDELHNMCVKLGYSPTRTVTLEALKSIDLDGSGTITFDEFEQLREHLRASYGFTLDEAEELKRLFARTVGDTDKKLSYEDIRRFNSYLAYNTTTDDIKTVMLTIDKEGDGKISFDELLKIIRGVRDLERERLLKLVSEQEVYDRLASLTAPLLAPSLPSTSPAGRPMTVGKKQGGKGRGMKAGLTQALGIDKLGAVLQRLGYHTTAEVRSEILSHELKDREDLASLTMDELDSLMLAYRRREGFTHDEMENLKEMFTQEQRETEAGKKSERIDALELGRVLRWFGIARTAQQTQCLIEEVDFSGTHQLAFAVFAKLMRWLLQVEAEKRLSVWEQHAEDDGTMKGALIDSALTCITGSEPDAGMMRMAGRGEKGLKDYDDLTLSEFEGFFKRYRKLYVEWAAQRSGFVPKEVQSLKEIWDKYDVDDNGWLDPLEMRQMVRDLVPEAVSVEGKAAIIQWLPSAFSEEKFRFGSFLTFMRKCFDWRDEKDIKCEVEVVKECGYSSDDVEFLRAIFSPNINYTGEVEFGALKEIFSSITEFSSYQLECFHELVRRTHPEGRPAARFPQFLLIVHKVTTQNLLGINDAADRTLRRQRQLTEQLDAERGRRASSYRFGARKSSDTLPDIPEGGVAGSRRPELVQDTDVDESYAAIVLMQKNLHVEHRSEKSNARR